MSWTAYNAPGELSDVPKFHSVCMSCSVSLNMSKNTKKNISKRSSIPLEFYSEKFTTTTE